MSFRQTTWNKITSENIGGFLSRTVTFVASTTQKQLLYLSKFMFVRNICSNLLRLQNFWKRTRGNVKNSFLSFFPFFSLLHLFPFFLFFFFPPCLLSHEEEEEKMTTSTSLHFVKDWQKMFILDTNSKYCTELRWTNDFMILKVSKSIYLLKLKAEADK